jgi:hypothetical protein
MSLIGIIVRFSSFFPEIRPSDARTVAVAGLVLILSPLVRSVPETKVKL